MSSTCTLPINQAIYQALLDKAASYPDQNSYQVKAYKKAADSVAEYDADIPNEFATFAGGYTVPTFVPYIGEKISEFISNFLEEQQNVPTAAVTTEAPVTTPAPTEETNEPLISVKKTALDYYNQMQEWNKPVVYTAENPRRSKRNIGKPKVEYYTKEDEQDEIAEAIEAVCAKKGYVYSDDLVAEFEAWLLTVDKYALEKYDYKSDKYIPRSKAEAAKEWAIYYSKGIEGQMKQKKTSKAIVKYCEKNGFEYSSLMDEKFAAWMADPANKDLITVTRTYGGCNCSQCNSKGDANTSYTYNKTPAGCIKTWFSTLKKTVIL